MPNNPHSALVLAVPADSPDASADATDLPSPWVSRWLALIPGGAVVLDLACGGGRHARLLARNGLQVLAVDRDAETLARLEGEAGIVIRRVDLETGDWPFDSARFGGIVVTRYLHRPLLPHIAGALAPGGILIYETFMEGQERFGRPANPDFLLRRGELREFAAAACLEILGFAESPPDVARAPVSQAICCRRPGG